MPNINPIAHISSPFTSKFAIPRQSNIVNSVSSTIVFEPDYRNIDALRGIEDFDYLWLIWHFSENVRDEWSPTVRPPRLGGNSRVGVFASRSPFRPNALGLSSVRLLRVELHSSDGPLLHIVGADLMDGTPIFDIKPYLPYCDAHPDARGGFAPTAPKVSLEVHCPDVLLKTIPQSLRQPLFETLSLDPRPSYHNDHERVYVFFFSDMEVSFNVQENNILNIVDVKKL